MAAITYKCPNCGGGLIFDPETQKYGCEYCRSQFSQEELEELSGKENENEDREEEQGEAENAALYTCPSCGAQIVTDETTAATFLLLLPQSGGAFGKTFRGIPAGFGDSLSD